MELISSIAAEVSSVAAAWFDELSARVWLVAVNWRAAELIWSVPSLISVEIKVNDLTRLRETKRARMAEDHQITNPTPKCSSSIRSR